MVIQKYFVLSFPPLESANRIYSSIILVSTFFKYTINQHKNTKTKKMTYEYEDLSANEIVELFKQWRDNNERRSDDVVRVWLQNPHPTKEYGSDEYIILEQVIIAALDTHKYWLAELCIVTLLKYFPDSMRVLRHKAALLEAQERYDESLAILERIIKADETNAAARKRRVAILQAQGLIPEAIKELVDYLKKFMSDAEGWQQLCALFLCAGELSRALFCAEECVLHHPHHHLAHQRVADILYTMGGVENLEQAKSYYCQTLKLNPNNVRALLGLFLTTSNLLTHYKGSSNASKRKDLLKLSGWAQKQVEVKQKEARANNSLTQIMQSLAITE